MLIAWACSLQLDHRGPVGLLIVDAPIPFGYRGPASLEDGHAQLPGTDRS